MNLSTKFQFELSEYDIEYEEELKKKQLEELKKKELEENAIEEEAPKDERAIPKPTQQQTEPKIQIDYSSIPPPKKTPPPSQDPPVPLDQEQIESVLKRLPESSVLPPEVPEPDSIASNRENSLNPPSPKNMRRSKVPFPPPRTPALTEQERRKQEEKQKQEVEKKKKQMKKIESMNEDKQAKALQNLEQEEDQKQTRRKKKASKEEEKLRNENEKAVQEAKAKANLEKKNVNRLKLISFSPEGNISDPTNIVIRLKFNQALVEEGQTLEALKWRPTISPSLLIEYKSWELEASRDGLVLETMGTLPNSHEFVVTIPAGSAGVLQEVTDIALSFKFRTRPMKILDVYPTSGTHSLQPFLFASFSQKIQPDKVLDRIKCQINKKTFALKLFKVENMNRLDTTLQSFIQKCPENQWLLFQPTEPFPPSSKVLVQIGPELPSAEGPLLSPDSSEIQFNTYSKFQVQKVDTSRSTENVKFTVHFNQPIVHSDENPSWFPAISPLPPGEGSWTVKHPFILEYTSNSPWALSTLYTLTIPANSPSIAADSLAKEYVYTITTEPIVCKCVIPSKNIKPIIFASFSQMIDPQQILSVTSVTSGNLLMKKTYDLKLANRVDLTDTKIIAEIEKTPEGKWFLFTLDKPLPHDSEIQIKIGPNIPSKEGPVTVNTNEFIHTMKTPPVFKVELQSSSQNNFTLSFSQDLVEGPFQHSINANTIGWVPKIEPDPIANWILVSPHVLQLQAEKICNSTEYTITLPTDKQSLFGETLSANPPPVFKFQTPLIEVVSFFPIAKNGPQERNPVMAVSFTQVIDPEKVLKECIHCWTVKKDKPIALTLLSGSTIVSDFPKLSGFINSSQPGRWLAFLPNEPFPYEAKVHVRVGPNLLSAEGPLKNTKAKHTYEFSIVGPFRVSSYSPKGPLTSKAIKTISITFSQPLVMDRLTNPFSNCGWQPTIKPSPPSGTWEFANSNDTIQWTSSQALPNASEFVVSVPSVSSYMNESLESEFSFTFSTPPAQILETFPISNSTTPVSPLILIVLDQEIDPDNIIKNTKLYANRTWRTHTSPRRATEKEIAENKEISNKITLLPERTWVVIAPQKPFPYSSKIIIKVGPNLGSKEGPLKSDKEYEFSFNTCPELNVYGQYPHGKIQLVFNQPIIPETFLNNPPIITPSLNLKFQWVFEPGNLSCNCSISWPRAHRFEIKISKKVTSIYNESLKEDFSIFNETEPNYVRRFYPMTAASSDPVMCIVTFQKLDQEQFLKCISFKVGLLGKSNYAPARIANPSEYNLEVKQMMATYEGFAIPFKSTKPFPNSTKVRVTIGPNIPSAEGPLLNSNKVKYSFDTVPAFSISKSSFAESVFCGSDIYLYFNHGINEELFDPSMIKIEPSIPVFRVQVKNTYIILTLDSLVNELLDCTIFISHAITDIYFQQLEFDSQWKFKLHPKAFSCYLKTESPQIQVYDPFFLAKYSGATFSIKTLNYKELRVCLYKMDIHKDLSKFEKFEYNLNENNDALDYMGCGNKVSDQVVAVKGLKKDIEQAFLVDLSPALEDSVGQVGLVIVPTKKAHFPNFWASRNVIRVWIQCTKIGLDAFANKESVLVLATNLVDGSPLSGVKVVLGLKDIKDTKASNEGIEGTLQMKGKILGIGTWKSQYAVLDKENLTIYKSKPSDKTNFKLRFPLNGTVFGPTRSATEKHVHSFQVKHANEIYYFSLSCASELQQWKDAIISNHGNWNQNLLRSSIIKEDGSIETNNDNTKLEETSPDASKGTVFTDAQGQAILLQQKIVAELLVAQLGKDSVFIKNVSGNSDSSDSTLVWHVFDDRSMYRPSESVHIKGYLRWIKRAAKENFEKLYPLGLNPEIKYVLMDSRNIQICEGETKCNVFGAFDFSLNLPNNINLGSTKLELKWTQKDDTYTHIHSFNVQEFRRPQFKVETLVHTVDPHLFGGQAIVKGDASYYAGGKLGDTPITWSVSSSEATFVPPGLSKYIFAAPKAPKPQNLKETKTLKGQTSEKGVHAVKISMSGSTDPPIPVGLNTQLEVVDLDQQVIKDSKNIIVHPCEYYLGIFSSSSTLRKEQNMPILLEMVVASFNAELIPNIDIILKYSYNTGPHVTEDKIVNLVSTSSPLKYEIPIPEKIESGKFTIQGTIFDSGSRKYITEISMTVESYTPVYGDPKKRKRIPMTPPSPPPPPSLRSVEAQNLLVKCDSSNYQVGDRAKIIIQSPFIPHTGFLFLRCNGGIIYSKTFEIKETTHSFELDLLEAYAPNVFVEIEVVGEDTRRNKKGNKDEQAPHVPTVGIGSLELSIKPSSKQLLLEVQPEDSQLEPGGETNISVKVTDWMKRPVQKAEVALIVVDESVLALSGYTLPDPLTKFYPKRPNNPHLLTSYRSRLHISLQEWKGKLQPEEAILTIQRFARGFIARRRYKKLKEEAKQRKEAKAKKNAYDFSQKTILFSNPNLKVNLVSRKSDKTLFSCVTVKKTSGITFNKEYQKLSAYSQFVSVIERFESPEKIYIITNRKEKEILFSKLKEDVFTEQTARYYFTSIYTSLEPLISNSFSFVNLRPENILLTLEGTIRIDLWFLNYPTPLIDEYTAPEVTTTTKNVSSNSSFSYTLGCFLHEMLVGYPPQSKEEKKSQIKLSEFASQIINELLEKDPSKRLKINVLTNQGHTWLDSVELVSVPPFAPKLHMLGGIQMDMLQEISESLNKTASLFSSNSAPLRSMSLPSAPPPLPPLPPSSAPSPSIQTRELEPLSSSWGNVQKFMVLGSQKTGKSALVIQFCQNFFIEDYDPTIENSYRKQVNVDGESSMIEILDTSGAEEFSAMIHQWIRGEQGFILFYSVIDRSSFESVQKFYRDIVSVKDTDSFPLVLVAGKSDLSSQRQVSEGEGLNLANLWNCPFFETSSKSKINIEEPFYELLRSVRRSQSRNMMYSAKKKSKGGFGFGGSSSSRKKDFNLKKKRAFEGEKERDRSSRNRVMKKELNAEMDDALILRGDSNFKKEMKKMKEEETDGLEDDLDQSEEEEEEEEATNPLILRSNFNPLANFTPSIETNEEGIAKIHVSIPDNITRYRVWAVSVTQDAQMYGMGDNLLTARLPLSLKCSPPRFLNYKDSCEMPVVIQNLTEKVLRAKVVVRARNATFGNGITEMGFEIEVPIGGRRVINFPVLTDRPGKAEFQVGCVAGGYGDATKLEIPIYPPATSESFAIFGSLEKDGDVLVQSIKQPKDVIPGWGSVNLSTCASQLQYLTDAILYNWVYPYGCNEQMSSKLITVVSLQDIIESFKVEALPSKFTISRFVSKSLKNLQENQRKDGSFGMWDQYSDCNLFLTGYVGMAVALCKEHGYSISGTLLNSWVTKLEKCLTQIHSSVNAHLSDHAHISLKAFTLYVRYRLNPSEILKNNAELFYRKYELDELPIEAIAWLLSILGDQSKNLPKSKYTEEIGRYLTQECQINESGGGFYYSYYDTYSKQYLFHSNIRTNSVILEALVIGYPQSPIIPKLVEGLLECREPGGHWANTQENAWVCYALYRYYQMFEKEKPNYVGKLWIGDMFCGEAKVKGFSTETINFSIPMKYVEQQNTSSTPEAEPIRDLILQKNGEGRLYYRLGINFAPINLEIPAEDYGFSVQRSYFFAPSKQAPGAPLVNIPQESGVWKVKKGTQILIHVTVSTRYLRHNVAIVDSLPGGLEMENPILKTSGEQLKEEKQKEEEKKQLIDEDYEGLSFNSNPQILAFNYQNLRDERAECFVGSLAPGIYIYKYCARATFVGSYICPPARSEEMYCPQIYGKSVSDKMIIE